MFILFRGEQETLVNGKGCVRGIERMVTGHRLSSQTCNLRLDPSFSGS